MGGGGGHFYTFKGFFLRSESEYLFGGRKISYISLGMPYILDILGGEQ